MTETLSAEEIQEISKILRSSEKNHPNHFDKANLWTDEDMQLALNTLQSKDKEIEALKGQVAAATGLLSEWVQPDKLEFWDKKGKSTEFINNTQATAEAFIASIRADEREKVIRGCIQEAETFEESYEDDGPVRELKEALEALLTKEQA